MTIGEIIQRIQSAYAHNVQRMDVRAFYLYKDVHTYAIRLSNRHIYNKMLSVRAFLLSKKLNKKQKISEWDYMTLPCVEMIKTPENECECIEFGCDISRSKYKLPKVLQSLSNNIIKTVTTIDGSTLFSPVSRTAAFFTKGNRYDTKSVYYINDGYLYTPKIHLDAISITALFEDPFEASKYPSYCDKEDENSVLCASPYEMEFPIDNDLIEALIALCLTELNNQPQDEDNREN